MGYIWRIIMQRTRKCEKEAWTMKRVRRKDKSEKNDFEIAVCSVCGYDEIEYFDLVENFLHRSSTCKRCGHVLIWDNGLLGDEKND